jgi:hypothetical protein
MTQYQQLAGLIAGKLNSIITKVNVNTGDVDAIQGGSLDSRYYTETEVDTFISNSTATTLNFNADNGVFTLTKGDGSTITVDLDGRFTDNVHADAMNQGVATTDTPNFVGVQVGTLNVSELTTDLVPDTDSALDLGETDKQYNDLYLSGQIYQSGVPIQSGEAKPLVYHENFTGDGSTTEFTVSKTLTSLIMTDINGLVQEKGEDFTHTDYSKTITFANAPQTGEVVQITYFYGGSKPIMKYETFTANGTSDSITVSDSLSQVVYVEINGLVQLKGDNYNTTGSLIEFEGTPTSGSEIAVLYYNTGDSSVSGTSNKLAKFGEDGLSVVDSLISETGNTVSIAGNLFVGGDTTTVNSTEVEIADKAIVLGAGAQSSELAAAPSGIKIGDEDSPLASILYNGSVWNFDGGIGSSTVINKSQSITFSGDVSGSGTITNLGDIEITNMDFNTSALRTEMDDYIGTYIQFRNDLNTGLNSLV